MQEVRAQFVTNGELFLLLLPQNIQRKLLIQSPGKLEINWGPKGMDGEAGREDTAVEMNDLDTWTEVLQTKC